MSDILSARDREAGKIAALNLGANDYVENPFGVGELLARIRAGLRQAVDPATRKGPIIARDVTIDLERWLVILSGGHVRLTPKVFGFLGHLARHASKLVGHTELLTAVWGAAHAADTQYSARRHWSASAEVGNSPIGR